jgi:hypothetical protein
MAARLGRFVAAIFIRHDGQARGRIFVAGDDRRMLAQDSPAVELIFTSAGFLASTH